MYNNSRASAKQIRPPWPNSKALMKNTLPLQTHKLPVRVTCRNNTKEKASWAGSQTNSEALSSWDTEKAALIAARQQAVTVLKTATEKAESASNIAKSNEGAFANRDRNVLIKDYRSSTKLALSKSCLEELDAIIQSTEVLAKLVCNGDLSEAVESCASIEQLLKDAPVALAQSDLKPFYSVIVVLSKNSAEFGLMTISLVMMLAAEIYFSTVFKLVRFYEPSSTSQYNPTRATLIVFTIVAFLLLFGTFVVGLRCFSDFDRGLLPSKVYVTEYVFPLRTSFNGMTVKLWVS
ncbi:hypothetical protein C8J55DRAFT_582486 [Lentinula edodes]|uniref:Uncharacterized protein n=1 Tax=Lentinula lateritia TaxID=40482 RepID=A0A9W9DII3_9AGAR|nr:hypothetical protein C8J55DRAFT_582486 [Lentinula edodes]